MGTYIPASPKGYLSALAPTVEEEIALRLRLATVSGSPHGLRDDYELFGLQPLLQSNPFALSGGEKAKLALLLAFCLSRAIISIDTTFEQIDGDSAPILLKRLDREVDEAKCCFLTHNRIPLLKQACTLFICLSNGRVHGFLTRSPDDPPVRHDPDIEDSLLHSLPPLSSCHNHNRDLVLSSLRFTYRCGRKQLRPALREIAVTLPAGKVTALVGPNGAGKSTLSKCLNGILRPDEGEIRWGQQKVRPHADPGNLVAYSFQDPDEQLFCKSVMDEMLFGQRNLGTPRSEALQRARDVAECLKIDDLLAAHPLDLPFVLRKRVAVAASFAMPSPWIVLDEPTLGQDYHWTSCVARFIRASAKGGRGIVIISHDDYFRNLVADQAVRLREGRVDG
jgi:energy-coupling factor transport system ATP-binding protein